MKPRAPITVAEIQQYAFFCGVPVRSDMRRAGIAWATGIWPFQTIVVGRDWFRLPYDEQQAALAHELGHIRRHHMLARVVLLPLCWFSFAQKIARGHEYAADAFAVQEGHADGLLSLISRFSAAEPDSVEAALSPHPLERASNVIRLMQEHQHEKLAA